MDNDKEKMAFQEFKKRMKGDMEEEMYEDDNLFYRFLIARDFNVDNSETMLRQHLEWRKKVDIKNVLKWTPPEVLQTYFVLTTLGNDKEGSILKYNHFGNTDFRGIFEACGLENWLKFLIYVFENDIIELKKHSERIGKIVNKIVYIENLENFSLAKATDRKVVSYLIQSISMYLNNYPEFLKETYVINAPVYFNIFFSLVKVCLPSTVIKKIKIYSDDSWKKDLLEAIDAEVLPTFLGGKRTDPDGNPLCLTLLPDVKPVPKSLYLNKSKRPFPTIKEAEKIVLKSTSTHELFFDVKEPDSNIEWEFEVKSGDIRFGVLYKDRHGKKTEVVPPQKINTSEYIGSGLYKCENVGTYILVFDNSYSILKSKEIWYKIKIIKPQEQMSN